MPTDNQLLDEFARSHSEKAFRELVERHLDLVHSVARRVTYNDDLARDVAQAVFLKLATRPDSVPKGLRLLAWLHRTTRHKAIDLVRSENRRRRREEIASQQQMQDMDSPDQDWKELEPVIDEALAKLPKADRSLVLARFYNKRSHASTALDLGITEDAARMRTARALNKLRGVLSKRGITATATLLGTTVSANAVTAAPASLASSICTSTLAAAGAGATAGTATTVLTLVKANIAAVAAIAVGVPIVAVQISQNSKLRSEVRSLRAEVANRGDSQQDKLGLSALVPKDDSNQESDADRANRTVAARQSLDEILANRDPLARLRSLLEYVDQLDASEIPSALAILRESTPKWDPDARVAAQLLLTRWGKSDIDAAFGYIEGRDYEKIGGDITVILSALAASDPQEAVAWLDDPGNKLANHPWMGNMLAGTVAKEWVRQSPDAAFAWAQTVPNTQRSGALTGVLGTIAAHDPVNASALAMEIEPGRARTDVIGQIAESWAERSPDEAIAWASALEGDDRQRGVRQVLAGWASAEPAEAAGYLDTIPNDQGRDEFIGSVAKSWARQAPDEAAEWLSTQAETKGKADAMGHVMWNWTVADPEAASTWLVAQTPGSSQDNAIAGLALAALADDPNAAISWAATISDDTHRATTLNRSARKWLQLDSVAAREWISNTDMLSADAVQQLLGAEE